MKSALTLVPLTVALLAVGSLSADGPNSKVNPEVPVRVSDASSFERNPASRYIIGAGDSLQISVWKEPDASVPNALVRPDGKIAIPLLKEVQVAGLTPTEAERAIAAGLSKLIDAPDVTVIVTNVNSKRVYVVGAVRKEGPIPYTRPMTVLEVLGEAGGLSPYAKRKKILIQRTLKPSGATTASGALKPADASDGNASTLQIIPFNYDEVLKGQRVEQNIVLLPGDMVVVP